MSYQPRTYRRSVDPTGLTCAEIVVKETDIFVCAERDVTDAAEDLVHRARWDLETYISTHPRFAESYVPVDVEDDAPAIVRQMADAARRANVGPMAAVAGAVAEYVARGLAELSPNVIVENGGDIYIMGDQDRTIALWAGRPGVDLIGLRVPPGLQPVAVCTSSATVGPSVSFGSAEAVTALSHDGALADAVVTALANTVHSEDDISNAIDAAKLMSGIFGVLISVNGHVGAWGDIHLVPLEHPVQ